MRTASTDSRLSTQCLGGVALLGEAWHWGRAERVQKTFALPVSLFLCFPCGSGCELSGASQVPACFHAPCHATLDASSDTYIIYLGHGILSKQQKSN